MKLGFLRHGTAVDAAPNDAMRWLTDDGRTEVRRVAGAVRQAGLLPARLVTSPLVRAVQTAELFAEGVGFAGAVEVEPALVPDGFDTERLRSWLRGLGEDAFVVFVGHEPSMTVFARELLRTPWLRELRKAELVLGRSTDTETSFVGRVDPRTLTLDRTP